MRVLAAPLFLLAARSVLAQSFTLTDLGLPPGYTSSSAKAVNDKGQVTGEISRGTRFSHAFLYSGGRMTDLGTLPGFTDSVGNAINEGGEVAGVATHPDPADPAADPALVVHAFTAQAGALQDLRPLGKALYISSGINAAGQVVGGVITLRDQSRAFVFRGDRVVVLRGAGWELQGADGINDAGDIVGSDLHGGGPRAFLYHGGEVTDLNRYLPAPADWVLERASGINERGTSSASAGAAARPTPSSSAAASWPTWARWRATRTPSKRTSTTSARSSERPKRRPAAPSARSSTIKAACPT